MDENESDMTDYRAAVARVVSALCTSYINIIKACLAVCAQHARVPRAVYFITYSKSFQFHIKCAHDDDCYIKRMVPHTQTRTFT